MIISFMYDGNVVKIIFNMIMLHSLLTEISMFLKRIKLFRKKHVQKHATLCYCAASLY